MPGQAPQEIVFGPFRLDLRRRILLQNDVSVPLGRRAFNVLAVLAARQAETVDKDVLLDLVWLGMTVEENNLQVQVVALRKALGAGWIATAPGVGYRLATTPAPAKASAGNPADKATIAVMPFSNIGRDAADDYIADGMAEDIITQLSRGRTLFVIARASTFTYKARTPDLREVGRALGVRYILTGSVQHSAGRIRISAQLIEAESANNVWVDRYDRDFADIFAVQDEIAAAVALAIDPAISAAEQRRIARKPPDRLDAWEAYQLGLWHQARGNAADLAQARTFLERAIRLDPGFAAAYAELAWVHHAEGVIYGTYSVQDTNTLIMTVAGEALRRDPSNAEAHAAIAIMYGTMGDPVSQDFHNDQAMTIDPNSVRARRGVAARLLFTGDPAAARTILVELLRVSPLDETAAANRAQIAMSHFFEGDYTMAASVARAAVAAHPGHPWSYRWLAASLGHLGRPEEAGPVLRRAIDISPQSFRL